MRAKDVLKDLLDRGIFASINQALDIPTATSLAESFSGVVTVVSFEEEVVQDVAKEEKKEDLLPRPPVVTVMGHVDHGKTSLLDAIRQTDIAAGEAGGITQHIGASMVSVDGRRIVFVDTPGHEAFTRMRARGAKVTDIVVLVVGADDGVMPQTLEAIDHARAASVPIIVAINKIDKPDAQAERVKRQLSDRGLMPEEWGGDTVMVEVSAKAKKNIEKLLEMILLVADLRELRANPESPASGTVLESRVDKGRGPVATVLVQGGTLHTGDVFICGAVYGKVRALFDDHGRPVKQAGPSTPVEVLGLQGVPSAGDHFQVADEAKARHIVEYRQSKLREASLARSAGARITLDQLHEQLKSGETKELPIIIKADVQGSVEVLSEMLPKLSSDEVKLKIIHASVGAVTETDVLLAFGLRRNYFRVQCAAGPQGSRSGAARERRDSPALGDLRGLGRNQTSHGRLTRAGLQGNASGPRRGAQHLPRQGLGRDRGLLRPGRSAQARRRGARAARRRSAVHRAHQFAEALQRRCQRSPRGLRVRRGCIELQRREGRRRAGVLLDAEARPGPSDRLTTALGKRVRRGGPR